MQKTLKYVSIVLAVTSIVGCATRGKYFNYQNRTALRLGVTTLQDAEQLFGQPVGSSSTTNREGQFEVRNYVYSEMTPGGANVRGMQLEFRNGVLNAYLYSSNFAEDSTVFDMNAIAQVERGSSTKADVLRIMGEPSGKALYPTTVKSLKDMASNNAEVWGWYYVLTDRRPAKLRFIDVAFNDAGIVTDIRTITTD